MKNGVDLRHTNEPGDRSDSKKEPTGSWMNKIRAAFAFVTVEPFLICFTLAPNISPVPVTILFLEKACRLDLNYTAEDCYNWTDNVAMKSRSIVNDLNTSGTIIQRCILVIVLLFVGAWSDLTGNRKALMVVPISGYLGSVFSLMLATYFFEEFPLFVTYLINMLPATLSGGYYVAQMGAYCYLADVTSLETRTFRMGIASTAIVLCDPIVRAVRPRFDDSLNYYAFFGATATFYLLGLLYTYFVIHDVKPMEIETTWNKKIMRFCNPENAWSTISIAYKLVQDRAKILLLIAAYFVICGPMYGNLNIKYEYFTQNFLMKYTEYIGFITYSQLMSACGILLAVTLFSKCLQIHDAILGIIAAASIVLSSCMYALAPNTLWLYSGPVLDLIGVSSFTIVRSLGTKVVAPQHIAKVFSLLCLTQTIIPEIYQPMYIKMYNNTKHTMMGAVYLIGAAMTAPAMLIFICMRCGTVDGSSDECNSEQCQPCLGDFTPPRRVMYKQFKKEERDRATAPQKKELYADENYVTSL